MGRKNVNDAEGACRAGDGQLPLDSLVRFGDHAMGGALPKILEADARRMVGVKFRQGERCQAQGQGYGVFLFCFFVCRVR